MAYYSWLTTLSENNIYKYRTVCFICGTLHFLLYKQPVYKQLGLNLRKVKHLLGLKHVTISNFVHKIFAYEKIATTLRNHILYTVNVNHYIVLNTLFKSMLHIGIEHFNLVNRLTCKNGEKLTNLSNH